tara:strand:- start:1126 stop:1344 length:219 start_codon:yes stop_codon:yes gene_type:complete
MWKLVIVLCGLAGNCQDYTEMNNASYKTEEQCLQVGATKVEGMMKDAISLNIPFSKIDSYCIQNPNAKKNSI